MLTQEPIYKPSSIFCFKPILLSAHKLTLLIYGDNSPGPPREFRTPAGSRTPYTIRTPQQGGTDTPPGAGPEPPRVSGCGHARGTAWLPLEDSSTNRIQCGRRSRARRGFCSVALLVACYQGAQCSRWRRPRRVCQSTMPVGHDGSVSPIMTPAR